MNPHKIYYLLLLLIEFCPITRDKQTPLSVDKMPFVCLNAGLHLTCCKKFYWAGRDVVEISSVLNDFLKRADLLQLFSYGCGLKTKAPIWYMHSSYGLSNYWNNNDDILHSWPIIYASWSSYGQTELMLPSLYNRLKKKDNFVS